MSLCIKNYFSEWEKKFEGNPLKEDAHKRSARVFNLLKSVSPVEDNSPVPDDSVMREFIGGSKLDYS